MTNFCKDLCNSYPSIGRKGRSYATGLMCYCSLCHKNFLRSDVHGYKCFCCHAKLRTTPKSKKRRVVNRY